MVLFLAASCQPATSEEQSTDRTTAAPALLLVGNYTRSVGEEPPQNGWLYLYAVDPEAGQADVVDSVACPVNPSYLAVGQNADYVFAANESRDGAVSSFRFDRTRQKLELINSQLVNGSAPCHLSLNEAQSHVLLANYSSGNVSVVPIGAGAALGQPTAVIQHQGQGPDKGRQAGPHAHMITPMPGEANAFVAVDLGIDQLIHYRLDTTAGKLEEVAKTNCEAGAGPRHLVFLPRQRRCYVLNELNHRVEVFSYAAIDQPFERIQVISTLADTSEAVTYPAAIKVHPNGRFLYASNRGKTEEENSIAIYEIDQETGKLTWLGIESTGGVFPRDFEIDPSGRYLLAANQRSDNIVVLKLEEEGAGLSRTGMEIDLHMPVCLKFIGS